MKRMFYIMFLFVICAQANEIFDLESQCNKGELGLKSSSSKKASSSSSAAGYNHSEIPSASCSMLVTKLAPGFNFSEKAGDRSQFYFDTFYDVVLNGVTLRVRFFVCDDEKDYNAIQAVVQTAYATRTTLSINFVNPQVNVLNFDEYENLKNKGTLVKTCYFAHDLTQAATTLYCPIQSIQLGYN